MNPNAFEFNPGTAFEFVPGKSWGAAEEKKEEEAPAESWDDEEEVVEEKVAAKVEEKVAAKVDAKQATEVVQKPNKKTVEAPVVAEVEVTPEAPEPEPAIESEEEDPGFVEDGKKHVNVIFIGHVDAGKSTLCGQIMWLSGNIDDRTLSRYEEDAKKKNRESWKFAYAMDTNEEERDKGKTVEVGRAFFTTENKKFTVLDAPGHKNFVPHMIGGASQADIGVLVISARKNEFEAGFEKEGQTREHIQLAKTAGVAELIIVINKMDDETVKWSEERYNECKSKLSPFLKKSGFRPRKDVKWLAISALKGFGVKDPLTKEMCPWFDGLSLLDTLDTMPPPERLLHLPARMPIVDKYQEMGLIVMGKLQSGTFKRKEACILQPINAKCQIETIWIHGEEAEIAQPGDNVKMKLKGIDENEVRQGYIMCPLAQPVKSATIFDAAIQFLSGGDTKSIICPGYTCVLHIHSVVEDVTITNLLYGFTKGKPDAKKKNPKFVREGEVVIARLKVPQSICIETFNDFDQFGRFMLRDEGRTIGLGKVKVLRK